MKKCDLIVAVLFSVAACGLLWTAPAMAQIVQSGHTVVDLATGQPANPGPVNLNTDEELLSNNGFETGAFPPWYHDGAWTISTTSPHTGTYCAYDIGNHWLRQDFTPTPAAQIVSATVWCRQPEAQISAIDFFYSAGNYSEDLIWVSATWQQYNVTSFIDPGTTVIGIRVWGYTGGGPAQDETFYDDISIQTAGAPNLSITMTPVNPPIIIPANGGSFDWNGTVTNNGSSPATFQVWVMVTLPNGAQFGPVLGPVPLTLSGGASIERLRTQSVPANAPAGNYTYTGNVGNYPGTVYDSDSFPFTKSALDQGGTYAGEWSNSGQPFESSVDAGVPSEFGLRGIYPNPFNPTTVLSLELPASGYVNLTVYDVSGRQVAQVVNGWRDAGLHEVTFDGSSLASGVYVAQLKAGNSVAMSKMVLMK